jgi:hypothetical protein
MYPAFDVFKKEPDGHYVWKSAAQTFEDARAAVKELNGTSEFMILNEDTGERTVVKPDVP